MFSARVDSQAETLLPNRRRRNFLRKQFLFGTTNCLPKTLRIDKLTLIFTVLCRRWERRASLIDAVRGCNDLADLMFLGYLDIRVTVETQGGHSSVPPAHTGIGILSKVISVVEDHPHEPDLTPANRKKYFIS